MGESGLSAGVSATVITPPVGLDLAGWAFGPSVGVHDDLFVKALVLESGASTVVLVTADLIGLGTHYAGTARSSIAERLGIDVTDVMISCSHTHSGPATMPLRRWGTPDESYVTGVVHSITETALSAASSARPARIGFGTGKVEGICANRRGDRGNVVDEALPVVRIDRDNGETLAVVMNYSCHPVAAHNYRNLISADFPGVAMRLVEQECPGATALFTLGAAGDVNPVAFHDMTYAKEYGTRIGHEVLGVARQISMGSECVIASAAESIKLAVQGLPSEAVLEREVATWKAEVFRLRENDGPHDKIEDGLIKQEWAEEALSVVRSGRARDHLDMELQAIRLNDSVFLAMPCELFVEIGMNIKTASPFASTTIVELANGSLCYLPTSEAYSRGGYETDFSAKVYGLYMLARDAQSTLEDGAKRLIGRLARGTP